jgi:hypothetical protein
LSAYGSEVLDSCNGNLKLIDTMKKSSFWSDASRGGAIIGLICAALALLGMLIPSVAFVFSLANFVAIIYLLFHFTRSRSALYTKEGFTYSQSLGFIIAMAIFTGIVMGAYQIIASNFLFTEKFEETLSQVIATYSQMGVMDNATMDKMSGMMRNYMFSPIYVLLSNILSYIFYFAFIGFFISIGTKREPDLFDQEDSADEENLDEE